MVRRALVGRVAVPARRMLSGDAAAAKQIGSSPAKKGGGVGQSLTWFSVGVALSLGAGYFQLSNDIAACSKNVQVSLEELRRDTLDSQKVLRKRIAELEGK